MAVVKVGVDSTGAEAGAKRVNKAFDDMVDGAKRVENSAERVGKGAEKVGTGADRARDGMGRFVKDARKVDKEARKARKGLFSFAKGLRKTSSEQSAVAKSSSALGRALKGALAFLGVRELVRYADTWTQVSSRLRLVTRSAEELAAVQEDLFDIAQDTRVGLQGTAELYQRLARASESLGKSTGETLGVTKAVSQAITISGVSAEAANAAIVQLGQGLASGALRGDELRSVLEQTPRLAQAIADGMGVAVGELRELGQAGELTADEVFGAIQAQAGVLEAEFGKVGKTAGQGFAQIRNAAIRLIGVLSDETGATSEFGDALSSVADFISGPATDATINFAVGLGALGDTFSFVGEGLSRFVNDAADDLDLLGTDGVDAIGLLGFTILNLPLIAKKGFLDLGNEINSFVKTTETKFELFKNTVVGTIATAFGDDAVVEAALSARQEFANDLIDIEAERAALEKQIALDLENSLRDIEDRRADRQKKIAKGREGFDVAGAGAKKVKEASKEAVKAQADFDKLAASVELARQKLAGFNEAGQGGVDLADDVARANDIFKGFKGQLDVTEAEVLALVQSERALSQALADANSAADNQVEALAAVADITGNIADLEEQLTALQSGEDPLKALADAEALQEARSIMEEYGTAVGVSQTELQELILKQKELGDAVETTKTKLEESEDAYEQLTEFGIQAARNIQSSFADFLYDPFSDGLDGMVTKFADSLRRMAAEALSQQILQGLFTGLAGATGGGGFFAAVAGGLTGRANGGPVNANEPVVVGEREAEVFVPRSNGTILNQDQLAGLTPATAPPKVEVTVPITNVTDPGAIPAAIESPAGQKAVMNVIQQNPEAVQRALS